MLIERVSTRMQDDLVVPYRVNGDPLGDFCESLRDLVAHVLMWDEINLAVLAEACRGRRHWSLESAWEAPEVGTMLNRSGVAAGREVPVELLVHRFAATRDALLDEFASFDEDRWLAPIPVAESMGWLSQYVMTVPRNAPYWHAAIHLGELATVAA